MTPRYTRRYFLVTTALTAGAVAGLTACPGVSGNRVQVFKRSSGGRRVSNAAKSHNANFLYVSQSAAISNPAHAGDNSKIVSLFISRERFNKLFPPGATMVDLRHV